MNAPRLVLLSGFLGSGKTTLLRRILDSAEAGSAAVVINEVADIGIDQRLVETTREGIELVAGGCICCTATDDMERVAALLLERRNSSQVPPFDTMFVEATGLADPMAVITTIRSGGGALGTLSAASVVTTLDAVHGSDQLKRFAEARRQLAAADLVVVTKSLHARPNSLRQFLAEAREINAHAPFIDASCNDAELAEALAHLPARQRRFVAIDAASSGHTAGVTTVNLISDAALHLDRLTFWLHELCQRTGSEILRVKGILQIESMANPIVVHCVSGVAYPAFRLQSLPEFSGVSQLVVIGRGLDASELKRTFGGLSA
jgi:G3E family GTPase